MIPLKLSQIAKVCDARLAGEDLTITALNTDTRSIVSGEVFLALKGPNFDGHKFIAKAEQQGAIALIVEKPVESELPQVIVSDTRRALGAIGAYIKAQVAPKTVAVTGSSGKTTVKEMLAAILRQRGKVLATQGNFNNDIGVPLTLLRLEPGDDYAVIELGANHLGEIAYTTSLVKPHVAILNNVAAAHLEGFGDLRGVARAKGEIFQGLGPTGVAIYNADSEFKPMWLERLGDQPKQAFSCKDEADFSAKQVSLDENGVASFTLVTPQGEQVIKLNLPGAHNVCNAVAAACAAVAMGASLTEVASGLTGMEPVKGRMNLKMMRPNLRVIDDSYNANVESVKAGIQSLANYPGTRILVLGDMGELGREARQYHEEVGEFAANAGLEHLLTLGVLSQSASTGFGDSGQHFSGRDHLIVQLMRIIDEAEGMVSILVKGSRSAHMERVIELLESQLAGGNAVC